ncbi:spirocyclase AveC family protein [Mycolicibacterium sp. 3033]|nr:spirocyclase AveC family protein [Mycolicibacterium aurantiacum]
MAVILLSTLVWISRKQGRLHWTAVIAFAGLLTGALDPLANWATFAIFDPRMLHFPFSWPYVNISPNLEPALAFLGGYAAYYVLNGMGFLAMHRRLTEPFLRRFDFFDRHRLGAVFVGAATLALPINAAIQMTWMAAGIFFYTEAVGPVLVIGTVHFPLVMAVYDSFIFAMVAVMCVRDEREELILVTAVAQRLGTRDERLPPSLTRQLLASATLGLVVFSAPLMVLAGLRVAGLSAPAYDENPYPTMKVYDPYGHLRDAGKPGPFYP